MSRIYEGLRLQGILSLVESHFKSTLAGLRRTCRLDELKGILMEANKGVQLGYAKDWKDTPS